MKRIALTRSVLTNGGIVWLIVAGMMYMRLPQHDVPVGDGRTMSRANIRSFRYQPVERVHAPTMGRFLADFASKELPVIISFEQNSDNPFINVSRETIEEMCGDVQVRMTSTGGSSDDWAGLRFEHGESHELRTVLGPSFFKSVDDSLYGLFDFSLPDSCPAFLEKYFIVPKYISQDLMQCVSPAREVYYRDAWPSLFRGRSGSRGKLHKDAAGTSFWMYQIEGRKEWRLLRFEGRNPTSAKWPEALDLFDEEPIVYQAILSPGELIIVPGNFPHQVLNVDNTIALAGNVITAFELESSRREVGTDTKNMPQYYLQLLNDLFKNETIVEKRIDPYGRHLPWKKFKSQWSSISV